MCTGYPYIGSTPTFLYFDLYLYTAYAAHYVYNAKEVDIHLPRYPPKRHTGKNIRVLLWTGFL